MSPNRDRVTRACLIGGALGDALGYPVEFIESGEAIIKEHGADAPSRLLRCSDGRVHVSDDTQMTLFTAEALHIDASIDAVHASYQRWLYTQMPDRFAKPSQPATAFLLDVPEILARRAPGNTCLSALVDNVQNARIPTLKSPPNDSKGCGAIMRSAPFGLVAAGRREAFELARDCGVLTHGHPSGYLSAAYFASLIFDLARGATLDDALDAASAMLSKEDRHEETTSAVATARALARCPSYEVIESLPNGGWVGEWALAIAIACSREVDVTNEAAVANAMWRAAAHGGDSDSTASLTGNFLGTMGATFPSAWLDDLEMRAVIERVAKGLV